MMSYEWICLHSQPDYVIISFFTASFMFITQRSGTKDYIYAISIRLIEWPANQKGAKLKSYTEHHVFYTQK